MVIPMMHEPAHIQGFARGGSPMRGGWGDPKSNFYK